MHARPDSAVAAAAQPLEVPVDVGRASELGEHRARTGDSTRQRLRSIDVLRACAILAVLALHIPHEAPGGWRNHLFFFPSLMADFGYQGVPLFILISGFCIHRLAATTLRSTGSYRFGWAQFWKRRFVRLYPPYVAAIALSLFAAFALHDRFVDPAHFFGWDLATHLLLIHNLTPEFTTGLANGAFWSLGTEEQLYALYFVLLAILTARGPRVAVWTAAIVTVAWRLSVPHLEAHSIDVGPFSIGSWHSWPFQYWLHWTLGAIAVDASLGNTRLPAWCSSLRPAMGFLALGTLFNDVTFELLAHTSGVLATWVPADLPTRLSLQFLGELSFLLAFFCILNSLLAREQRGQRICPGERSLASIGRISYSLYLVHIPIIYTLDRLLPLGASPGEWITRYVVYLTVVMAGGAAFFWLVERWFLHGQWPSASARPSLSAAPVA